MRKKIICIIIACLLFGAIASGYYLYTHEDKITVAIVPLDSRPCKVPVSFRANGGYARYFTACGITGRLSLSCR